MNIFVLDEDPITAAEYHCNKHVVKMILESTQLMSNAFWHYNLQGVYKQTHKNHPATLWVQQSSTNFNWLGTLALSLCKEYTYRYGKVHKCEALIKQMLSESSKIPFLENNQTPFAQCMPDQYKNPSPVIAYRNYYIGDKSRFAEWTTRPIPSWFQDYSK